MTVLNGKEIPMNVERQKELIERVAELEMDRLDKALLNGQISDDEYDTEVNELEDWVKESYADLKR